MRHTVLATATSALAVAAMLTGGVGIAAAQPDEQGVVSGLVPGDMDVAGLSLGYGSFGTGSLMGLISNLVNAGSVVLSVDVPNSTGSYAPGSFGSYGPEASIGELSVAPLGSLGGAS